MLRTHEVYQEPVFFTKGKIQSGLRNSSRYSRFIYNSKIKQEKEIFP